MDIKEWQKELYNTAKSKGWYDAEVKQSTDVERIMLMVTELAEAVEEIRGNKEAVYVKDGKPEGIATELADCVIRVMDYFEHKGWDLEEVIKQKNDYNKTRPYRHGGKTI